VEPSAVVVGAGIAGLASALSLTHTGWRVTVLERAPELGEIGAGFAMSRNAVAAFCGLGFEDAAVAALGCRTRASGIWDLHGHPILTINADPVTQQSVALIGVHRRRLHDALLTASREAGVEIVTGARVTGLDPGEPGGAPAVIDGREAALVVGADGVNSAVRAALFPGRSAVYSGYSSWRAVTSRAPDDQTLRQFWGPHAEFGLMPISDTETYWYGYVALPERTTFDDELTAAERRFADWTDPVQEVMARTVPEAVMRHDVLHLPHGIPRYVTGRVVMAGDAAHAFLPTMGQGAATALEDGICVGLLIGSPVAEGGDLTAAARAYDEARRPRCRALARAALASARFGAHLGGGYRQTFRNAMMRLVPASAIQRGAQSAMGWVPPDAGVPAP
jgi:2-polyprenyl-6-methoxyphenol hydroxylase-like FAD-dependent oxidoreductase